MGRTPRHRHPHPEPRHRQPPRRDHRTPSPHPRLLVARDMVARLRRARRDRDADAHPRPGRHDPPRRERQRPPPAPPPRSNARSPPPTKSTASRTPNPPPTTTRTSAGHGRPTTAPDQSHTSSTKPDCTASSPTSQEPSTPGENPGPAGGSPYTPTAHTWVVIAGLAFDNADFGGLNIPAGSGPRWRSNPIGNLQEGASYILRPPRTMTRHQPTPRFRRALVLFLLLLLPLAGCGISDPSANHPKAPASTSTTARTSTSRPRAGDPAPERGGVIPPTARSAQTELATGAGRSAPEDALERYAQLASNWSSVTSRA
jgi:hypothetical protein